MAKKKVAPKPTRTLLEVAKSLPPPRASGFIDKLPAEAQQQLLELRAAYQAKKLPAHMSTARIYREVVSPQHPDLCGESTFRRWMSEAAHG